MVATTRGKAAVAMSSYDDDPLEASYHDDVLDTSVDDDLLDMDISDNNDLSDMDISDDNDLSDMDISDDDDLWDMDTSDDDDEVESPESLYLFKAYGAYCAFADGRKLQIAQSLPSIPTLVQTIFGLELQWAPGLCPLFNAASAPNLDTLRSLPEFSSDDERAWAIYLLIFEHNGQPPLVYVGSGTHRSLGVQYRLDEYSRGAGFSRYTAAAIAKGYTLTHKKILVKTPSPLHLPARALFYILEAAITFSLYAYEDRGIVDPTLTKHPMGFVNPIWRIMFPSGLERSVFVWPHRSQTRGRHTSCRAKRQRTSEGALG
ncbi:hypothetical protein B0H65DRAFT_448316 [Neurospora tetraspora]|uniref:Uncharacterized protein n=1 Tax=Neurospora tetraspora TaxID=94610 RepID=A0AAE0JMW0_9PEZI|nr:hypothetical protein B0H65DRAFT_448316 [Neurospora tetraspora]